MKSTQGTATAHLCVVTPSFAKQDNRFSKFDDEHRIAYGWAIVSTEDGSTPYFDLHGDHIPMGAIVKASVDFMKSSRASDDMHAEKKTGEVVYCAPVMKGTVVDPEHPTREGLWIGVQIHDDAVYKATKEGDRRGFSIGGWLTEAEYVETKRRVKGFELQKFDRAHAESLRKGEKPTRIFRSFQLGFISTVDWPAQEGALISVVKRAGKPESLLWASKAAVFTDEVDGHQHMINLNYFGEDGCGSTSWNVSAGSEYSHSHSVVRGADGAIQILADSGHTHDLAAGQPAIVFVPTDAVVVVQASAASNAANKSTQGATVPHLGSTTEGTMSNTPDFAKQLADLTKRNERLERVAKMSGAQKAHFDTLTQDDAEAFLSKTNAERDEIVAKAAEDDKPVWTGEVTKVSVRKRDGELALQLAKQNEANAVALAKSEVAVEKAEIRKIAAETIGNLAGGDEVHDYIVKSIRKGGGDAATIEKALTAMKGWNALAGEAGVAKGANPGADPVSAGVDSDLRKAVEDFQKANNISSYEVAFNKAIASDPKARELYEQLEG